MMAGELRTTDSFMPYLSSEGLEGEKYVHCLLSFMFSILPSQLSRSSCCGQLKLSPQMLPCGRQSWGCVGRPLPGPRLIRDVPKGLSLPSWGNNIFWKLFLHTLFYHEGLILISSSLIFNLNSMFCQCTVPLIQVWFDSAFCDSQSKPYRLLIAKIRWMTIWYPQENSMLRRALHLELQKTVSIKI